MFLKHSFIFLCFILCYLRLFDYLYVYLYNIIKKTCLAKFEALVYKFDTHTPCAMTRLYTYSNYLNSAVLIYYHYKL